MIKIFLAAFLLVSSSHAQTNFPANQDFQSTSTTLKSSGFALNVDQLIELKFHPITETIAIDIKKIQFELEPKREKLSGKVCKLEFGISTWNADGRWVNDFSYQRILLDKKIEVEPKILYEIAVPKQNISFPKNSLDQTNNKYRVTFKIYIDRPEKIGSPCEAHVPVHTPYLNKYLLDQVSLLSQISQQAAQSDIQKTSQPRPVNLSLQSWKTYENFDVATNDAKLLPFQTISNCDAMCKEDSSCIAYTFNKQNRNCWLKTSIQSIFQINPDIAISAVKSVVVKNNLQSDSPSLQIFENFDISTNDEVRGIANSNEESCKVTCLREDSCAALTFNKTNNMCWLKKSVSNIFAIDKNIAISAVKFNDQKSKEQFQVATTNVGSQQKSMKAYALVIGNSAYAGNNRLANPVNDARAVASKLRDLGFKVTEITDADRSKLVSALAQFSRTASDADLSLLFYAGHGVQITGTNYMLPIDLNLNDLTQAPLQGISLNDVVDKYLPGKTKLVFLDACRDNPLMQVASRSVSRGLAPINVSEGTLISYATKDGSVAQDGDGKNSPFTSALLEHIGDPDDIAVVLRKVREKVMKTTGNKQQPWEYGSLTGGALVLSAIKPK
jgi:hypothetical protein